MRITCPNCEKSLSLGQAKKGRYRPKCKYCGEPFDLFIESDGQVKIRQRVGGTQQSADSSMADDPGPPAEAGRTMAVMETGDREVEIPDRLGGYRILRLLGRGAMGAVYEAKQMSLDRLVALKTIRGRLADNPASLARFTREAYAAAQLNHHNVVQIYDFGEDAGLHFFSMEWVRGGPLDHLIREKGRLEPRLAVSYAVQAARGLQFAHRHGMVHRDIKPANLLLTNDGVIKVADLGLVKIPDHGDAVAEQDAEVDLASGTQVTMQGTAVGTPAYMAPEQSENAAGVDARADIYSLGCTLFFMLAGHPPFQDTVITDLKQQHANAEPPRLTEINHRVPEEIETIVSKAMEKQVERRYESLAEMILDLESYLGVALESDFSPTTQQIDAWEAVVTKYLHATRSKKWWRWAPMLCIASAIALTCLVVLLGGGARWILMGLGMIIGIIGADLSLNASLVGRPVATHVRKWLGTWSRWDWFLNGFGVLTASLLIMAGGLWPGILIGVLLGTATGYCIHRFLFLPTVKAEQSPLKDAEQMIRELRVGGSDEDDLRLFVARYSGMGWQTLYESLFGYESLVQIRDKLRRDSSFNNPVDLISVRDHLCGWLRRKTEEHQQIEDHRRLAGIEERGLKQEGLSSGEARDRAWQIAAAVMENTRFEPHANAGGKSGDAMAVMHKRERMKQMIADARSGKYRRQREPLAVVRFVLGGQTRLLAGCLLMTVFASWAYRHGVFDQFKQLNAMDTVRQGELDLEQFTTMLQGVASTGLQAESNSSLFAGTVNGWSVGVAGLLLMLASFVSGWRMTPFAAAASVIILFGPNWGIPGIGSLAESWMTAAAIGVLIYVPGVIWGERKEV